jgi:hypothetical protein
MPSSRVQSTCCCSKITREESRELKENVSNVFVG